MLLNWIASRFFKNTLYIKIKSDWLSVRFVDQNRTFEDRPLVALRPDRKGKQIVVAVGSGALSAHSQGGGVTIHNGFDHPRTCIRDFEIAEATLRYFVSQTLSGSTLLLKPVVVMHPLEKIEGGLTQIEHRALSELAESAGARKAYVWTGRVLDLQELTTLQFPQSGGKLGWG